MKELIEIQNQPAEIDVNFEVMREHLETELEKYRLVVTADTVSGAKKAATELNKSKKVINDRIKEEEDRAAAPIRKVTEKRKALVQMIEDGRQDILKQVKIFEEETLEKALKLLQDTRQEAWDQKGIDEEFRSAEIKDLVKLGAVTGKGNLAASARRELESRVQQDKSLQDRTRMRLVELENQSYRAGLAAPLTRDHVQHFLFADEETYSAELQRILDAEVERQAAAERRMREQQERERQQAEDAKQREQERQQRMAQQQDDDSAPETPQEVPESEAAGSAPEPVSDEQAPQQDQQPIPAGDTKTYEVECTFRVTVPATIGAKNVEQQLRDRMQQAGFKSLQSVFARQALVEEA